MSFARRISGLVGASLGARCTQIPQRGVIPGSLFHSQEQTWSPKRRLCISAPLSSPAQAKPSSAVEDACRALMARGYDPASFWEQPIVWGDQDPFQHVNNVQYVRFFESGRIKWLVSVGTELGGPEKAQAMLKGQGISLILKSIQVNFKRPVTFPDTLLIGHKTHKPSGSETQFNLIAAAYSCAQRAFVADSEAVLVWYDYDNLKRCDPGEQARSILAKRFSAAAATQGVQNEQSR